MNILSEWHKSYYEKREVDLSSLYSLKTNEAEFYELTDVLKAFVSEQRKWFSVGDIIDRHPIFNKLFVLYAAEWWKRKYEGGHWTWKHILEDLNISEDSITPQERSKCVRDGLDRWGLQIRDTTGKRFLGAIALQGGLPIHFLTTEQGSIYRVLERLVRHSEGIVVSTSNLENWAEELKDNLPITYRKPEIYSLLSQVVGVLFEIKQEAKDEKNESILNEWRTNNNRWLKELPIAAPFEEVDRLISKLLGVVASTNDRKKEAVDFLKIHRILNRADDGLIQASGEIEISEIVSIEKLRRLFGFPIFKKLPASFTLQINFANSSKEITLYKVLGQDKYRRRDEIIQLKDDTLFHHVTCILQTADGQKWSITPDRGDSLDKDLPWVFEPIDEATDEFVYIGQGSVSCKAESVLVVVPSGGSLETEGEKLHLGEFRSLQVFQTHSPCIVHVGNSKYRIKPNSLRNTEFIIDGEAVDWVLPTSMPVYRGIPNIYSKNNGKKVIINQKLIYDCSDGTIVPKEDYRGIVQLRYVKQGITLWKKKIVIIDVYSEEEFDYEKSALRLHGWGSVQITSKLDHISIKRNREDRKEWVYEFDERFLPTHLNTRLSWNIKDGGAKVELPIPYKGVHLVNSLNEKVDSESLLELNKLYGYHLRVFPGNESFFQLLFELITTEPEVVKSKVDINMEEDEHSRNFKLNDYKYRFQEILSHTSSLDDRVRVSVIIRGWVIYRVNIAQYDVQILRENGSLYLDYSTACGSNETPEIKAQRLHLPGIEEINVPVYESGSLDLQSLEEGSPWLLYPSKNSSINARPSFWSGINDISALSEDVNELSAAIALSDKQERRRAIEEAVENMTNDLSSYSWETLNGLVNEYSHLPLSTLDVWEVAINNYDMMALLASGVFELPRGFFERFTVELPFMLYSIPISSWKKAAKQIYGDIFSTLSEKPQLFKELYLSKLQVEPWTVSQIHNIFEITLESTFEICSDDFARSNSQMLNFLKEQCFQELLNNHSDEQWPPSDLLNNLIKSNSRDVENIYVKKNWKTIVYNTPILLAHHCIAHEQIGLNFNPQLVRDVRSIKQFDEEWFSTMFNIALAQFYIQNK